MNLEVNQTSPLPPFSIKDRLQFVRLRRAGSSMEEIRKQHAEAVAKVFQQKIDEIQKCTEAMLKTLENLQSIAKESENFAFLASGKKQIADLEQRINNFHAKQKETEVILEEVKQEYKEKLADGEDLKEQLDGLKRKLKKTLPTIPMSKLLHAAGGALCDKISSHEERCISKSFEKRPTCASSTRQ